MNDSREFQTIKAEVDGALGRLTLNRPERLNAVSATMLQPVPEPASLTLLASAGGLGWCVCSRSGMRRFIKNWFGPPTVS